MPLHRALYLPPVGPIGDPRVLVDLAGRAEAAGWDGVFLLDHVVGPAPIADCWTSLAAMAAATRTIRVGSAVTPLPRRRPRIVARQASTVSRLSGGRAIVGIGLVWVASSTRSAGVIARAAACDGIFPISDHTLRPEELAPMVAAVRDAGLRPDRPYDVAVAGNASPAWDRPNPDGVDLGALAEAGATWWMESLGDWDPLALSMQVVDAGPPPG